MNHVKPCAIAAALFLPSLLLPPFLVPVCLLFCINGNHARLPAWCAWLDTPDQPLPGDLTLPAVAAVYASCGWFVCAWYWLGWRNQAQGLAARFGVPVKMPWSPEPGYYEDRATGLWWLRKPILGGRFQFKAGWRTYPDGRGGWLAVPCLTVTKP